MNIIDILLILFLIGWAVRGYLIGFSVSLTTFTGVVGGLAGGIFLTMRLADVLPNFFENTSTMIVLVYLLLFFVISTFFRVMALFFRKALKSTDMVDADSFSGALVGIVEGLILSAILIISLVFCPLDAPRKAVGKSSIAKYMLYSARVIMYSLPPEVKSQADDVLKRSSAPTYTPRSHPSPAPPIEE